jgi:IstB-like ATP binding protein/Major Facilitator Superfamily
VTLAASLGWFFDAYVITIYALTVPLIAAEFDLTTDILSGAIGSIFLLGYTIGTIGFGVSGDRFGRRVMLGVSIVGYGVVTALTALASGIGSLAAFRFLTGLGGGGELSIGAIDIGARTYGSVKSILDNKLDRRPSAKARHGRNADPACQYPWSALLQLGETILLKHPTLDQLHALDLHGMAKAFAEISAADEADSLGHHEWLGLLLDREASWRRDKRLKARLRIAKLRHSAAIEDVDYRSSRGLDRCALPKACRRRMDRSRRRPSGDRADRRRQELAGMRHRPQSLPRQSLGALSPRA